MAPHAASSAGGPPLNPAATTRTLVALAALAALVAPAPAAQAQSSQGFERCGDPELTLVFMNDDLDVQSDGFVHASGTFFIQFQARGERAFDVESLKFSFGPHADGFPETCDAPEWVTGPYAKNFRADYEPLDGFHVPINTCNVPDGTYAVAISAYDKDLNELARYYTKAKVENGPGNNKAERCANPDKTAPWPIVLPGDGERLDGGSGLYVEVGEEVGAIEAFVNGRPIQLAEGLGPWRDDDLVPDLGYHPTLRGTDAAQGQAEKRQYPAFTWDGLLGSGDVVRVRVTDKWGNVAEKVAHLGDPTIGGRATLAAPEFELRVPVTDLTADANGTAVYNVTYVTKTSEGLHADLYVRGADGGELPPGVTYRLSPNHVMMGGNQDLDGNVTLIAKPDAKPGTYQIRFVANYLAGAGRAGDPGGCRGGVRAPAARVGFGLRGGTRPRRRPWTRPRLKKGPPSRPAGAARACSTPRSSSPSRSR
ncbi:MAG TPA: hypothetical protein VHH36_04955 [Candidatus Thermoplasmatota archaeon]|nr:hypothetical protein [Candidatus Thermoplasmatota archaeon]